MVVKREPVGKLTPAEKELFDRIHNPVTVDTTAEEVISTAQAVFPGATVKSRRGPLPVIIVDQQEKTPLTRGFDPKLVQVETAHLETGDYSLKGATHLLAIERKSLADLLHCCTGDRERFMDQLRRMKNYPTRFLVVEATREEIEAEVYSRNVRATSVINTLLGAAVRWNVCVQYCDGPSEAARMVQWICLKTAQLQKEGFYAASESDTDIRVVEPHDSTVHKPEEPRIP